MYTGWIIGSGFVAVGPHSEVSGKNPQPGRLIWNIESTDVRGDFDRMKAAGAIVVREPYEFEGMPGSTIATLADPDDNYFQLMSPMGPEGSGAGSNLQPLALNRWTDEFLPACALHAQIGHSGPITTRRPD